MEAGSCTSEWLETYDVRHSHSNKGNNGAELALVVFLFLFLKTHLYSSGYSFENKTGQVKNEKAPNSWLNQPRPPPTTVALAGHQLPAIGSLALVVHSAARRHWSTARTLT